MTGSKNTEVHFINQQMQHSLCLAITDGKYFQIDTYGTAERVMPEKASQSIQLEKEMAEVLVAMLRREFHID